ncbi:MAG: hypothetical protein CUN56_00140 [Phototrophicales bacterium]|nr:MAG: hypothetical protein CUN56_00140 [Phototrophicales bacterium]
MILPEQVNLAEVAFLAFKEAEELETQSRVVLARKRDDTAMSQQLAAAIAADLSATPSTEVDGINLAHIVKRSVANRLNLLGFTADSEKAQLWVDELFERGNLNAIQYDVIEAALRDGEAGIIVDYDEEAQSFRFYPHQRFTAVEVGGDGEGIRPYYRNNDPNQPLQAIAKRWTETTWNKRKPETAQRLTLYIAEQPGLPARIEKYKMNNAGAWQEHQDPSDPTWPLWWTDTRTKRGQSLPIPAIIFSTPDRQPISRRILGLQAASNELLATYLGASRLSAYQILVAFGWLPTTDGKPPAEDGSNLLKIRPRQILGAPNKRPSEASLSAIPAGDTSGLLDGIDRLNVWAALVAGMPVKNFIFSRSANSAQSLRQGEAELDAEVNKHQSYFGGAWKLLAATCAAIAAAYQSLPTEIEDAIFTPLFAPKEKQGDILNDVQAMKLAGIPDEIIWQRILNLLPNEAEQVQRIADENSQETAGSNNTANETGA